MKAYPTKEQSYTVLKTHKVKNGKFDYENLDPFLQGTLVAKDGESLPARDISMTTTCLVEVVKDLVLRVSALEKK